MFDGPIVAVDADVSGGSLHIVGSDDLRVTVTKRVRSGVIGPDQEEKVDGDRLVIRSDCPGLFSPSCRVDYVVRVPAGVAVRVHADGGTAAVEGIAGDVDAHINGGKVAITYTITPTDVKAEHQRRPGRGRGPRRA